MMFRPDTKSTPTPVDPAILRRLVSPGGLSYEQFHELADGAVVEQVPSGTILFEKGDHDGHIIYVLSGEVVLAGSDGAEKIVGGEGSAKNAVSPEQPRICSATCVTNVSVARFDYKRFENLEGPIQAGIDVSHINENDDEEVDLGETWMARVLQSDRFKYIPPVSLQEMFMRLEERPVSKGHTIIIQDEEADFYYILKRGRCTVTRKNSNGAQIVLCYLTSGDGFGEEAMLSRNVRNATVTMETDGAVLRLSRADFVKLLGDPLIAKLKLEEAQSMVAEGATFVDVRPPVKGAAAVFLLRSSGFDAFLLDGGLNATQCV